MRRDLTPREIVAELDRYIVGQKDAKKAVAVALRNRWRRSRLAPDMRDEVAPKNILMIGPTGVGKTEIARRLAKLTGSPFLKIEASKFTEVGYVGRDVDSILRDLIEAGILLVRNERAEEVKVRAERAAEQRLLDLLTPRASAADGQAWEEQRKSTKRLLRDGELEKHEVELEVSDDAMPMLNMMGGQGPESMGIDLKGMFGNMFGQKKSTKKMRVADARRVLISQEEDKLIDRSQVEAEALQRVERSGIVFLDEIDKIASSSDGVRGAEVSREGVQRDLLPIVEGTTVNTRYGSVSSDHVLFIAAGAFHVSKPSDLIPEMQGRFPVRVHLSDLSPDDFERILLEPENALTRQYQALLATEDVELVFTPEAVRRLAEVAASVNATTENIGARRLHTVLETLLEDISFEAPERQGESIEITAAMVDERLTELAGDQDLARFIL